MKTRVTGANITMPTKAEVNEIVEHFHGCSTVLSIKLQSRSLPIFKLKRWCMQMDRYMNTQADDWTTYSISDRDRLRNRLAHTLSAYFVHVNPSIGVQESARVLHPYLDKTYTWYDPHFTPNPEEEK